MEGPSCIINHWNKQHIRQNVCYAEKQNWALMLFRRENFTTTTETNCRCFTWNLLAMETKYIWCCVMIISWINLHAVFRQHWKEVHLLKLNMKQGAFHTCLCSAFWGACGMFTVNVTGYWIYWLWNGRRSDLFYYLSQGELESSEKYLFTHPHTHA